MNMIADFILIAALLLVQFLGAPITWTLIIALVLIILVRVARGERL